MGTCLCCDPVHEITRPCLWLSAPTWADSYPMSRWLSNEQDLTVHVTHDQRLSAGKKSLLLEDGETHDWGRKKKTNLNKTKKKKYNNLTVRIWLQGEKGRWRSRVFVVIARMKGQKRRIIKIERQNSVIYWNKPAESCVLLWTSCNAMVPQPNRAAMYYLP